MHFFEQFFRVRGGRLYLTFFILDTFFIFYLSLNGAISKEK